MLIHKVKTVIPAALVLLLVSFAFAAGTVKISKDDLKQMLGNPDVTVIDVRTASDWDSSQWKIQGAVREDPANVEKWAAKYPKDRKIVLYCA